MGFTHVLIAQPARLWRFLGFFQTPGLRVVHGLTALLCILQLVSSAPMNVYGATPSASAWYHIWGGASLCLLALLQTGLSFKKHGLRHFYPYLWKDTEQLAKDIKQSLHFQLVAPRPKGLGAAVQGLGLGALLLTAFSGLAWFYLWQTGSADAEGARTFHDAVSLLMILYLLGHGGMALLHFAAWQRHSRQRD